MPNYSLIACERGTPPATLIKLARMAALARFLRYELEMQRRRPSVRCVRTRTEARISIVRFSHFAMFA